MVIERCYHSVLLQVGAFLASSTTKPNDFDVLVLQNLAFPACLSFLYLEFPFVPAYIEYERLLALGVEKTADSASVFNLVLSVFIHEDYLFIVLDHEAFIEIFRKISILN